MTFGLCLQTTHKLILHCSNPSNAKMKQIFRDHLNCRYSVWSQRQTQRRPTYSAAKTDPQSETNLQNIEVKYGDVMSSNSVNWSCSRRLRRSTATARTRIEAAKLESIVIGIFVNTSLSYHPQDRRHQWLIGQAYEDWCICINDDVRKLCLSRWHPSCQLLDNHAAVPQSMTEWNLWEIGYEEIVLRSSQYS